MGTIRNLCTLYLVLNLTQPEHDGDCEELVQPVLGGELYAVALISTLCALTLFTLFMRSYNLLLLPAIRSMFCKAHRELPPMKT